MTADKNSKNLFNIHVNFVTSYRVIKMIIDDIQQLINIKYLQILTFRLIKKTQKHTNAHVEKLINTVKAYKITKKCQ